MLMDLNIEFLSFALALSVAFNSVTAGEANGLISAMVEAIG
jgi:hypothetical protein